MSRTNSVKVYLDDAAVFSKYLLEHVKHTSFVPQLVVESELRVTVSRYEFVKSKVELLGHFVHGENEKVD